MHCISNMLKSLCEPTGRWTWKPWYLKSQCFRIKLDDTLVWQMNKLAFTIHLFYMQAGRAIANSVVKVHIVVVLWIWNEVIANGHTSQTVSDWAEVNVQVQLNIRSLCIHTLLVCPHKPGGVFSPNLGKQVLFMGMNNWVSIRISLTHALMEVRINISKY